MKYKARKYAEALVAVLLAGKKEDSNKAFIEGFLKFLEKNGDLKKAKEAVSLAERMLFKKTGRRKIIIETARKTDQKNLIQPFIKKGDFVEEHMTPELIAGVKVTVNGNRQLDFSLNKKLQEVFETR